MKRTVGANYEILDDHDLVTVLFGHKVLPLTADQAWKLHISMTSLNEGLTWCCGWYGHHVDAFRAACAL